MTMESLVVRDGVMVAKAAGFSRVVIETYSKEVVSLSKERNHGRSEIIAVLQEIEELSGDLDLFQLVFIGREANEGAHLCAKQASENRRRCMWIIYIPSFIIQCLQKDCKPTDS